jgi:hypothetical protein
LSKLRWKYREKDLNVERHWMVILKEMVNGEGEKDREGGEGRNRK